jgi:hypothetical protein
MSKAQRRQEPSHPLTANVQPTRPKHLIKAAVPGGRMCQRALLDHLLEFLLMPLALLTTGRPP